MEYPEDPYIQISSKQNDTTLQNDTQGNTSLFCIQSQPFLNECKGRSGGGVGGYEMEMGGESQLEMDKVENVMEMVTREGTGEYGYNKVRTETRKWCPS